MHVSFMDCVGIDGMVNAKQYVPYINSNHERNQSVMESALDLVASPDDDSNLLSDQSVQLVVEMRCCVGGGPMEIQNTNSPST